MNHINDNIEKTSHGKTYYKKNIVICFKNKYFRYFFRRNFWPYLIHNNINQT
jgi:hypothetical protein